jgi:small subunit ribosomal protein S17
MQETQTKTRGRRQVRTGIVVSDKMDKTVVVAVEHTTVHRLYHRYMRRTSKLTAHDETNQCRTGDRVVLVSTRPLSKSKRWRVREILDRSDRG